MDPVEQGLTTQEDYDKSMGILKKAAPQAAAMLADDTYQLISAASKPFREQGPIDLAMKIPSLATEEGRADLGKYMLDLIDFEKYGRPIDKITGYMEEDDPDVKAVREGIYFGSLVPSIPGLLKLGTKVARFAAPIAGPAIPFIAAGGMGEAEASGLTKIPKIADKVQDLIKPKVGPQQTKGYTFIEMPDEFYQFTGSREQYINASPELRITQRNTYKKHLELEEKYGDLPIWQKLMKNYKANPISVDGYSYNRNVEKKIPHIEKYLETKKTKFSKSKPGLENVTMEDYVFPKDASGNLLPPPQQTKFRKLVDDYQQYLSDRRRYENKYLKGKSKGGDYYDTIARTEANQQLNWMLENARQNPDSVFQVVEVTGKAGKPVRVGVLDKDSGITYYRDGFLEGDKLVRQLGELDPALHKSIINHPDFIETKKLFDAQVIRVCNYSRKGC